MPHPALPQACETDTGAPCESSADVDRTLPARPVSWNDAEEQVPQDALLSPSEPSLPRNIQLVRKTTLSWKTVLIASGVALVLSLLAGVYATMLFQAVLPADGTEGQVLSLGTSGPAWVSADTASSDLAGTSLSVSGASTLDGTLGVTGPSTLSGASFSDDVTITSGNSLSVSTVQATPGTDLALTAPTVTLSAALSVPSGTSTLSALSVTGASTLASATLTGALDVTGLATLGSLAVTGASSLTTLGVSGHSTLASLDVTGAATSDSVTATTGAFDTLSVTSGGSTVYTLPSNAGTSGQVLSTDGSGGATWTTVETSGGASDGPPGCLDVRQALNAGWDNTAWIPLPLYIKRDGAIPESLMVILNVIAVLTSSSSWEAYDGDVYTVASASDEWRISQTTGQVSVSGTWMSFANPAGAVLFDLSFFDPLTPCSSTLTATY
ncbi:hypothetical protein KIPB_005472 [Kipferlia bialata]|uniref:Uncharacterized protein n=1 Tax=Kipferlia bialata TaxID=797122 RepID=A0A9K3GIX9_9EUKA|nr:hypothetical protein KIPB_005472 [Kipferlia bialata]|eukprot:g5472.t1